MITTIKLRNGKTTLELNPLELDWFNIVAEPFVSITIIGVNKRKVRPLSDIVETFRSDNKVFAILSDGLLWCGLQVGDVVRFNVHTTKLKFEGEHGNCLKTQNQITSHVP